ncbi:MAG: DUF4157 domain-containing protein [Pseudomonadota bacterium]
MRDKSAAMSVMLPESLRARAARLDAAFPGGPVQVHLSARPGRIGARAFAADGQVWMAPDAFAPESHAGRALIGHELAHLAQQARMGAMEAGVLDDAALEAAAEAFGEAFAALGEDAGPWCVVAVGDAAAPQGVVQCSYGRAQNMKPLPLRIRDDDIEDDDEDDDDDDDAPTPVASGAQAVSSDERNGLAKSVFNISRGIAGGAVSATNTTFAVMGGTGVAGSVTGALASGAAAAMAPAALVLGPVGIAFMIADLTLSFVSAAKTYAHIKELESILVYAEAGSGKLAAHPGTVNAIAFTLNKKNKKLKRKGVGCIPVLGSICNTVYTAGRSIQKRNDNSRGVERRSHATTLWVNMMAKDRYAIAACSSLLGEKMFGKIRMYSDGHRVLKKKMRSL